MADEFGFEPDSAAVATAEPGAAEDFGFTPLFQSDPDLADIRANYSQELNDPRVAGRLYALTHNEVGSQGPEAQQAFVETVFNRAAARGATLAQTISDPAYYPARSLRPADLTRKDATRYGEMALNAAQGSNVSNYATGNASGNVGFAGGPETARYGGERFGIEGPDLGKVPRAQPADVQMTYVEKGQAVTPVEMQVARAKPVGNEFGFVPEQPAPAAAAPIPEMPPQTITPEAPQPAATDPAAYGLDITPEQIQAAEKIYRTPLIPFTPIKAQPGQSAATSAYNAVQNTVGGFISGATSIQGLSNLLPPVALTTLAVNAPHVWDQVQEAEKTPAWSQQRWEAGANVVASLLGARAAGELTAQMATASLQPGAAPGVGSAGPQPGLFAYPGRPGRGPEMPPPGAGWQQRGNVWVNVGPAEAVATHPAEFGFVPELEAPRAELPAPETPTAPFEAVTPGAEAQAPAGGAQPSYIKANAPATTQINYRAGSNEPLYVRLVDGSEHRITNVSPIRMDGEIVLEDGNTVDPGVVSHILDENRQPIAAWGTEAADQRMISGQAPPPATSTAPFEAVTAAAAPPAEPGAQLALPGGPELPSTIEGQWQKLPDETRTAITGELATRGVDPGAIAQLTPGQAAALVLHPAPDETGQEPSAGQVTSADFAPPAAPPEPAPEPNTATLATNYPITEVPLDQITLSKDVPQFKAGADEKGIVEPLAGKYERIGTPPVQLWQRNNGQLELISGRHRLDLAKRTGERTIPAQILREVDGFDARQAARLDAEINIRDNQGSIADYANYFKNSGITQEAAEARGLLARRTGQAGFAIARDGGESLFALHQSGRLTDAQAQAIVEAAPRNDGLQRVGIKNALEGRSAQSTANLIRGLKANLGAQPEPSQLDLLSADDSAMQAAARAGQRAGAIQRELSEQVNSVAGAAKRPAKAKALGVNVEDPASVMTKLLELRGLQDRAKNWDMDAPLRDIILRGDMAPEQAIKALSAKPPRYEGGELFGRVAEVSPQTFRSQDAAYRSAEAVKPNFDRTLEQIAKAAGGDAITAPIKSLERAAAKVAADYNGDWSKIKDLVRGTIVVRDMAHARIVVGSLAQHFGIAPKRDFSQPLETGYQDALFNPIIDGHATEIQVHIAPIFHAKMRPEAHALYERKQNIERAAKAEGRAFSVQEARTIERLNGAIKRVFQEALGISSTASEGLQGRAPSDLISSGVIGRGVAPPSKAQPEPSLATTMAQAPSGLPWSVTSMKDLALGNRATAFSSVITPSIISEEPISQAESLAAPRVAEDVQTFLDFNQVPPARKAEATQDINKTLALAGDPALQRFYASGFAGVPGPQLAAALRANRNRVSIIYNDVISRQKPTWNIEGSIIANPADMATAAQALRSPDFESMKVVMRDPLTKRVLAAEIVSTGTINESILHPRDVFRVFARMKDKYPNGELILSHNHPSGFPKPSPQDRNVQAQIHEAAAVVGVPLVDHVITDGRQYFSFDQEELTGDGFGTLPNPVKAPWEVIRQEESPQINSPDKLAEYAASLRADDPNAAHVFYVGTQYNLKAVERVPNGTNMPAVRQAIANGIARESAYAVLVDFGQAPPHHAMFNLVNSVHDAMGVKFLDATWPGMDSARESGAYALREEPPATPAPAGAGEVVYHGTPKGQFESLKDSEGGIFFTTNPDLAKSYTQHRGLWLSKSKTPQVYAATLDFKNPLVIDALGTRYDNIPVPWQEWKQKVFGNLPKNAVSVRDAVKYAKENGYDGFIVKNVIDTLDPESRVKSDVHVAFSTDQIKGLKPQAPAGAGVPEPALRQVRPTPTLTEESYGGTAPIQRPQASAITAGAAAEAPGGALPRLAPLSEMERTTLETLRRAKASLSPAGRRKLARLEARRIIQVDLLGHNDVFNLSGEETIDWATRQREAEAAEAAKAEAEAVAQKAQMSLFEKPDMPYVTGTARVNESNGAGKGPPGPPGASMFAPNTPPRSNPLPVWAQRAGTKFAGWWREKLPRSYEIVRKVPESPAITEHQRLLDGERSFMNNFTNQPWWQALRRRPEEELIDLEHQAVMSYRRLLERGTPRETAWSQAVAQMPPDVQALFQHRESRFPIERWAAGQLGVDAPSYTGDPYMARLTNEEGKAVVDLHPQIANWGRHLRQSIGSFDKSRVHPTMKMGIQSGIQYEPPTVAAFTRELYSTRLENTARMLQRLKQEGVLFDEKLDALAANKALKKDAGSVTLVRGFGGKDYWARSRVEAQFLAQNLNTTSGSGAVGKLVRLANAFTRNPNLMFNPLPHTTKNMAFKYALARIGNYTLRKSAREFGTDPQMRARFEAVMPMPTTGTTLPQLRALEAGTYLERIVAKGGKWLSGNHFSGRFNFAKADPALRYALWKTYVKKGLSDQEAANHVWVDLIRYDENSGALNFWKGIPFNFFSTWRLGTYISLVKQLRSHPIRALLFIGAVEYLREILFRKFGWWTHLPVDYVDAPLAGAIEDPKTIPGVAATTLLFGPGGGQAPHTIEDVMKALHGDPGQTARVVNMFWGLSQLYNMPQEFQAYLKDKDPKHLALILMNGAFSTHSALKYEPHRLMQWLPEWMPGMQKSAIVRQAEALQATVKAKAEKGRATYEARHGVGASLQYRTEAGQMEALRRAAGVRPPKPGPPKRTRILPGPSRTGKPRGFGEAEPAAAPAVQLAGQPNTVLRPGAPSRPIIQWMKENFLDPDAARLQRLTRPRIDPDYVA